MSEPGRDTQAAVDRVYSHAANLMLHQDLGADGTKRELVRLGIGEEAAQAVVTNLQKQINTAKRNAAKKSMLYGALWCIGGTVLTFANVGFIFWGAIVFGGIQFVKGLIAYSSV
jgi:hypothetical protein